MTPSNYTRCRTALIIFLIALVIVLVTCRRK